MNKIPKIFLITILINIFFNKGLHALEILEVKIIDSYKVSRDFPGKLLPSEQSKLAFEIPGKIKLINVDVGDDGLWSATLDIFKQGGGEDTANGMEVNFLGRLPFDPGVVRGGDDGVHRIIADPDGESAIAFSEVVSAVNQFLSSATNDDELEII